MTDEDLSKDLPLESSQASVSSVFIHGWFRVDIAAPCLRAMPLPAQVSAQCEILIMIRMSLLPYDGEVAGVFSFLLRVEKQPSCA